jgi:hypothetical protein
VVIYTGLAYSCVNVVVEMIVTESYMFPYNTEFDMDHVNLHNQECKYEKHT